MVIALKGGLKVGKDAVTEMVIKYLAEFGIKAENRKFADKLKDIVCLLINCTREQLEDRDFKTTLIGPDWVVYRVNGSSYEMVDSDLIFGTLDEANEYVESMKHIYDNGIFVTKVELTPRMLLQLIGTEGGRELIHPNMWVNSLFSEYTEESNWVISDCRFPNEKQRIEKEGGIVIEITRPFELRFPQYAYLIEETGSEEKALAKLAGIDKELYDTLTHTSETILNGVDFTYSVINDGTIDELEEKILDILRVSNFL